MASFSSATTTAKTAVEHENHLLKHRPPAMPETRTGAEGTAKRNIVRRRGGGGGGAAKGRGTGNKIDDGSTYDDPAFIDEHDPNYDSEEETGFEYIPSASPPRNDYLLDMRPITARAPMTLSQYKKKIEKMLQEYFVSAEVAEILQSIQELNVPEFSYELVKRAVSMSLDHSYKEKELVSQMLSAAYPDVLSTNVIGKGFERLFELVDELEKDVPTAKDDISTFLARCVVDEVLPPSFLSDIVVCNLGGDIVEHAKRVLSRDHSGAKLEHSWGPGDGRPVEDLKVAIDQLLLEYLLSRQLSEASRCIRELNAPHFHHEIVKRAVSQAVDKSEDERQAMSSLLAFLVAEDVLSTQQVLMGFKRVRSVIGDLELDTPTAPAILAEFEKKAIQDGILPANF